MLSDGSCQTPCYQEESECNLTLVKIFLAKHSHSKSDPPDLLPLQSIMWHGERIRGREYGSGHVDHSGHGPPRDRTNQSIEFEHIHLSVFISITITSALGWLVSLSLFAFNIHFRSHRSALSSFVFRNCLLFQLHPNVQSIVEQSDPCWLHARLSEHHLHGN